MPYIIKSLQHLPDDMRSDVIEKGGEENGVSGNEEEYLSDEEYSDRLQDIYTDPDNSDVIKSGSMKVGVIYLSYKSIASVCEYMNGYWFGTMDSVIKGGKEKPAALEYQTKDPMRIGAVYKDAVDEYIGRHDKTPAAKEAYAEEHPALYNRFRAKYKEKCDKLCALAETIAKEEGKTNF